MHPGQAPAPHPTAVRVNPPIEGAEASVLSEVTKAPMPQGEKLPGGAVRINPEGIDVDANLLQQLTHHHVTVEMAKADADIRAQHVAAIKLAKQLKSREKAMETYWEKIVGSYQMRDAIAVLNREADAEIAKEAAAEQLAKASKRK